MSHKIQTHVRLLIVVGALLFISAIKTYHWHDMPYLADESWTIQLGLEKNSRELVQHIALHEFVAMPASWLTLKGITTIVGHIEESVRHMQFLFSLVGLAWLYQLGKMLYNHNIGVYSILILGVSPLFLTQAPQARTYTHVLFISAGMMLFFMRWIHTRKFTDALTYVMLGVFGVYSHQYIIYLVIAQAIAMMISVKYDWRRLVGGFTLFAYIAIALLVGWGLVFLSIFVMPSTSDGITYAISPDKGFFAYLREALTWQLQPTFLVAPLFAIIGTIVSFKAKYHNLYRKPHGLFLWIIIIATLVIAWLVNVYMISNLTFRNLILITPFLALLAGVGIDMIASHISVKISAIVVTTLFFVFASLDPYFSPKASSQFYKQTAEILQETYTNKTGVIVIQNMWLGIQSIYYIRHRTTINTDDVIFITTEGEENSLARMPFYPENTYYLSSLTEDDFRDSVSQYDHLQFILWYSEGSARIEQLLAENYFYQAQLIESSDEASVVIYRRMPQNVETQLQFGEFDLLQWQLLEDVRVQPCESITVESFWALNDTPQVDYSLSLTLITPDGNALNRSDSQLSYARTLTWQTGQTYADYRTIDIPCDTPTGDYALIMGVYDPLTFTSLPTAQPDGTPTGNAFLYLTTLSVETSQ